MSDLSRRNLLALAAASTALAKKKTDAGTPIGVQLYTVRDVLPNDPDAVLRSIAEIGYKEVEAGRAGLDKLSPLFARYGLKAPSVGLELPLITGEGKPPESVTLASALEEAKKAGASYVGCGYSGPQKDADGYKRVCEAMNRTGEAARTAGLQFTYHHHAYEFGGEPGKRAWDYYLEFWDPKLVAIEMDTYWLSVAGQDPAAMIARYSGRVQLVHLKDKAFGTAVQYDQNMKPYTFKEVGTGVIDFPAVLAAARKAGVQHYFVEQDATPGHPIDSLRISYNNLRKMKL
jgi:sugar phosphate isomerase/epimerase